MTMNFYAPRELETLEQSIGDLVSLAARDCCHSAHTVLPPARGQMEFR